MKRTLKDMIMSKINTITSMIDLIDEDLDKVADDGLRDELVKRLRELQATKSALAIKVNLSEEN